MCSDHQCRHGIRRADDEADAPFSRRFADETVPDGGQRPDVRDPRHTPEGTNVVTSPDAIYRFDTASASEVNSGEVSTGARRPSPGRRPDRHGSPNELVFVDAVIDGAKER